MYTESTIIVTFVFRGTTIQLLKIITKVTLKFSEKVIISFIMLNL